MAERPQGRYKSLLSNTLLFGLSTFGSKLVVFFLLPVYTRFLPTDDYGMMDIVANSCNFITPLITLCVHEAVIRFGVEQERRKRDVFTTAILTIVIGYALLFCFWPLLKKITLISEYLPLIYAYVFASAVRTSVVAFVRASGLVRLFALDGVFTTVITIVLKVTFVAGLKMGVPGDGLATVAGDLCSAAFLILALRLYRFFSLKGLRRSVTREMLRYCAPLMPTAIFWWVTNVSDHYFITYLLGKDINGLYSVASIIPRAITLVSAIFIQAWQLSAFNEYKGREGARFFSTVFRSYYTLIFMAASGIILLAQPVIRLLAAKNYFEAWRYVPFLVLAVSFSCLVTFLGTVYNAAKRNAMVTVTTFAGAAVNFALNWLLIPDYGANGAAFATFASYLLVFIVRAVHSRRYTPIAMQPPRIFLNLALLLAQTWVALTAPERWILWECLILLAIVACNFGNLLFLLRQTRAAFTKRQRP